METAKPLSRLACSEFGTIADKISPWIIFLFAIHQAALHALASNRQSLEWSINLRNGQPKLFFKHVHSPPSCIQIRLERTMNKQHLVESAVDALPGYT